MAINKKLISFATQAQFDAYLANNNIDPRSIVFIEDKKRIWTHGVFFDTSWDYITDKPPTYTPSAHTLGSHSDVTITSNSAGEILKWNGSRWINNTLAEAGIAAASQLNNYLPLTGGTLTGSSYNMLELKRSSANGSSILFSNSSANLGKIGFTSNGNLIIGTGTSTDGTANMLSITPSGIAQFYGNISTSGLVTGTGFSKTGATDEHVLLGSGGHKAISDFVPKQWTGAGDGAEIWMKSDVTTAGHSLGLHFTNSTNSTTATYQSRIQSRRGSGNYSDLIFSIRDTDIMLEILGQDRRVNILNQLTVQNNEVYHTGNLNISNFNASLVTSTSTTGITNVNTTNSNTYLNLIQGASVASSTQIMGSNGVSVSSNTSGRVTIAGVGDFRDYGLGRNTALNIDLADGKTEAGLYTSNTSDSNSPMPGSSGSVLNLWSAVSNGANAQIWIRANNTSGEDVYVRHSTNAGVFYPWQRLWHSGNLANGTTAQYIRGDGSLATYSDTTYSAMSVAEGTAGTATSLRTMRADYLKQIIQHYDTNSVTGIRAGASGTTTNSTATNPYIKVIDDNTYRSQIRLVGSGATTISSDASGNITISSTDTNTTYSTGTLAQLNAGTDTTGRLQTAKLLNDWLNPKLDTKFDKTGGRLTTGTGDVNIELWRGTNASWNILNSGGYLRFQSNYTTVVGAYFDALKLDYNTGNALFKGNVTAPTFSGALAGNATTSTTATYLTRAGTSITTAPATHGLRFDTQVSSSTTGIFPTSNNSNAVITLNRHSGNYDSQLGFSSNGDIYYRAFSNVALNTTQAWNKLWHSGNFANGTTSQYIRGDGSLATYSDTTYSEITQDQIVSTSSSAVGLITGRRLKYAFDNITAANATNATSANILNRRGDNRGGFKPSDITSGALITTFSTQGALLSQTNNSDYVDVIGLSTYQDSSAGQVNALAFDKSSHRITHFMGTFGTSSWSSNKTLAYTDGTGASGTWGINITGNASSATYASAVTLTADNSSNATRYPLFVDAATGNKSPRTDTGFTYNPSTGALTATSFVGNLTGNASTASTATKVNNKLILKFDTGTTENTNLYTYDGSAAKTINITAGSNVSLTKSANTITINATNTTYSTGTLAQLNTGTDTTGRLQTAKNLNDWLGNKFQVVTALPVSPAAGVFYFVKE